MEVQQGCQPGSSDPWEGKMTAETLPGMAGKTLDEAASISCRCIQAWSHRSRWAANTPSTASPGTDDEKEGGTGTVQDNCNKRTMLMIKATSRARRRVFGSVHTDSFQEWGETLPGLTESMPSGVLRRRLFLAGWSEKPIPVSNCRCNTTTQKRGKFIWISLIHTNKHCKCEILLIHSGTIRTITNPY